MVNLSAEKWPSSMEALERGADGLRNYDLDTPTLHAAIDAARNQMNFVQETQGSSGTISAMDMHNQDPYQCELLNEWDSLAVDDSVGANR